MGKDFDSPSRLVASRRWGRSVDATHLVRKRWSVEEVDDGTTKQKELTSQSGTVPLIASQRQRLSDGGPDVQHPRRILRVQVSQCNTFGLKRQL